MTTPYNDNAPDIDAGDMTPEEARETQAQRPFNHTRLDWQRFKERASWDVGGFAQRYILESWPHGKTSAEVMKDYAKEYGVHHKTIHRAIANFGWNAMRHEVQKQLKFRGLNLYGKPELDDFLETNPTEYGLAVKHALAMNKVRTKMDAMLEAIEEPKQMTEWLKAYEAFRLLSRETPDNPPPMDVVAGSNEADRLAAIKALDEEYTGPPIGETK